MSLAEDLAPLLSQRLSELAPPEPALSLRRAARSVSGAARSLFDGLRGLGARLLGRPAVAKRAVRRRRPAPPRQVFRGDAGLRLHLTFFSKMKDQWLPPITYIRIPHATLRDMTDLWQHGDDLAAAEVLAEAFVAGYRLPNGEDWLAEARVDRIDLRNENEGLSFWG